MPQTGKRKSPVFTESRLQGTYTFSDRKLESEYEHVQNIQAQTK